jgi:hypothetical protein
VARSTTGWPGLGGRGVCLRHAREIGGGDADSRGAALAPGSRRSWRSSPLRSARCVFVGWGRLWRRGIRPVLVDPSGDRANGVVARRGCLEAVGVSYDAVLQSCSTSLNPGRGYWANCTGTQRRRYMLAAGRLQRLLGDSLTEANCASFRASAQSSVNALTGAFRRAWLAVKSALAGAARGSSEPATGGVSAPLLLARADSATRASTSRLTELASHLQTTCTA